MMRFRTRRTTTDSRTMRTRVGATAAFALVLATSTAHAAITTPAELVAAITGGKAGDTVVIGPGTFELLEPLRPQPGMTIKGAGAGLTILRNAPTWAPGNVGLSNDEGAQIGGIDCTKYLVHLPRDTGANITLSDLTLTGPTLHGGICGVNLRQIELARIEFKSFLWAGARLFIVAGSNIHDNTFFDAGGKSNVTSGSSGGALFLTYFSKVDIYNNQFGRSEGNDSYGVKGREARQVHIHDNTLDVFFSVELPFEGDHTVEIDHNYLGGAISVPKYGGGPVPAGGYAFHVHHNYFKTSYAFEYQRNAVEIDHNLFDFPTSDDGGNLIASFDAVAASPGGTKMHDNLIRNPGRGIYWNEGVYNNFSFYNNHVRAATTVTPRTEGLFDFRPARDGATTDFKTISIRDNIFELTGTPRPLMRNTESHAAVIENNTLTGISDSASYANAPVARPRGPLAPLCFRVGAAHGWTIDGWSLVRTPTPVPAGDCSLGADAGAGGSGSDATPGNRGAPGGSASGDGSDTLAATPTAAAPDGGSGCSLSPSTDRRRFASTWASLAAVAMLLTGARRQYRKRLTAR